MTEPKAVIEEPCRECHGRGRPSGSPLERCRYCNGTGSKQRAISLADFLALLDAAREQQETD